MIVAKCCLKYFPEYMPQVISTILEEWHNNEDGIPWRTLYEEYIGELVKNNAESFLISHDEGENMIGFGAVIKNYTPTLQDVGPWITKVIIKKEYRGHGIGKLLIEQLIKKAKVKYRDQRYVYVSVEDKGPFYEHLGFENCDKLAYFPGWTEKMYRYKMNG